MSVNQYLPPVVSIPSALEITNITRANPMVVTATPNSDQSNTYQVNQLVKLFIPNPYRMIQANGLQAQILSVSGDQITLAIDSSNFDDFVVPTGNVEQPASLSPSGSRNLEFNNTTARVPFQSLNNRGN